MRTDEVLSSTCAKSNDVNAGGRKTEESITEDAVIVTIKSDDAILFSDEASVPSLDSESEDDESEEEWESDEEDIEDDDEGELWLICFIC
jgi:hypothetical protein